MKNDQTIALNVLYGKKERKYILSMFQDITPIVKIKLFFLTIPNGGRWHYLEVKKLSALLRRIRSKNHGDFYCLNRVHSFATES